MHWQSNIGRVWEMEIAIAGGGLTGLAFAAISRKLGLRATVFERNGRLRDEGSGIFIWPGGVQVLRFLAGRDDLLEVGHSIDSLDTYDRHGSPINSVTVKHESTLMASAVMFQRSRLMQY